MKYLIYFLLFSSVVFSQNYQYAIEEAKDKLSNGPSNLIASQITETSAVLNWTAPANKTVVSDYGIYSNNVLLATSVGTGTTYKLTGLTPETSYTIIVRSIDKKGKMSFDSNKYSFITKKLSAPTGLNASEITETSAVLTWNAPIINSSIADYGIYSNNILLATSIGTGTTYKLTGLTPETAYSLTVRSIDNTGKMSGDSNVKTFTTNKIVVVVPVLNPPTNLIASQITETTAVLTWNAPTNATSVKDYGIYSNNILLVTSVGTGTTYKLTGLTSETAYSLTVRSIDNGGKMSVDSNKHSFTTNKVGAPTNLIASQITETSVVLSWTAPTNATSVKDYGIYSNNILLATSVGTGTTYKLTGLTPETAYSLTVRSIDNAGKMSVDSNVKTFTTNKIVVVVPVLDPPTNLIAGQITETTAVLTWTAPTDATSVKDYGIYRNNVLLATSVGIGTTYTLTGMTPETPYTLTVRSIDKAGKNSVDSNQRSFTTNKVSAPTDLVATQITETSAVLNWNIATSLEDYDYGIYRNNVLLATSFGEGTTYTLKGLAPETAYTLTVRLLDKSGKTSVDSKAHSFTTNKIVVVVPVLNPPTNLVASQITETSAVLTWTAPTDATSVKDYGIYRNNILLATSTGTGTTYKLTGLTPETVYSLTVRSIDNAGKMSVDSNVKTFTTNKIVVVVPVLNPPTNLVASQITETSVVLTWTAPTDATSVKDYGIYSNNILLATSTGTGTTYKLTGLTPETVYSVTARSIDNAGKMSVDSNVKTFTTNKIVVVVPVLNPPTNLIASQITETTAVLTWTAPTDATSVKDYGIYNNNILLATSTGTGITYKLTGLTPETVYSLTVRSIDNAGKMSVDSNEHSFTTKKVGAPTNLIASQITETSVVLTWTAPTDATSVKDYGIYSNNILLATSVGTGITYKVEGLTPETAYTLTVRSIDKNGKMSVDSNAQTFTTSKIDTTTGVKNQLEEIDYFNAYLLPIAQKATIQNAIDKYGSVRLEKGDYSGVNIVMKSNQRLYGHPSLTQVSNITIAAGSSNVFLQDLFPNGKDVTFQAGGVISNCTLKTIKWATIKATNAMVENNLFINIMSSIHFDCSGSGYFRNNKIIKHQVHGLSNMLIMKGNSATPSYGNVHLHSNFLTPAGDATIINNLKSSTFVGLDSEAWNYSGTGTNPMLNMQNMGDVKITDFGGGNGYSTVQTPTFNIDADNLFFLNKYIQGEGKSGPPTVSAKTDVLYYKGEHDDYKRGTGTVTGFDLKTHFLGNGYEKDITLNGSVQNAAISNPSKITTAILGTKYTPFARPSWEILPDPLGANWKTDRIGKPDQTAYIQNLINTKGIAELPEGVFYISSTLKMPVDGSKGIVGAGTGKTVLVGLKDDFPLVTLSESANGDNHIILSNLTLQGGSVGVYAPDEMDLIAFTNLKYVVFRNQKYGIQLYRIFGLDNCFFDGVSFVDCTVGFFQDPNPVYSFADAGYVDKVVFYNGQYLNCGTAVSMKATRADNLNAWINCKFDGNDLAFDISGHNFPIAANCDFTNHKGANIIRDSPLALYNCNFYNNSITDAIIRAQGTFMEGCSLMDNSPVFSSTVHYLMSNYVLNSTIKGNVLRTYGITQDVFVNSTLSANPTLSKLLVKVKDNVPTVVIDASPNPYPQLLVTQ